MTKAQAAYRKYLLSDHWTLLREKAIKRDGRKCVRCGSNKKIQVHHTRYRTNWFDGVLEDVKTLCRKCHRKAHGFTIWSDFDLLHRKLSLALEQGTPEYKNLPGPEDERELVRLIECDTHRRETEALFRNVGGMRIILTSSRMWDSWLRKADTVKHRYWIWSQKKRIRIESELQKGGN